MKNINIPKEILEIYKKLKEANFDAYLVGGCVRDLILSEVEGLMGNEPKDWDVATSAKPREIQKIFPDSAYENNFGTVAIKTRSENPLLKIVEITTFRLEGKYTDKRHPDEIKFAKTVEEDLSRRDFTCNAMALQCDANIRMHANNTNKCEFIDFYGGQKDIKNKIIRAVGNAEERFNEDALRMMRAIRFAAQLDFAIEEKTFSAIKKEAGLIEMIAKERIYDELKKIIMTASAKRGVELLEECGLLKHIIPELRQGIDNGQNKHHIYTIWEHNLRALDYAAKKNYSFEVRMASLLHDIGKPATKAGEGPDCTFYNHEIVGAKITARIMDRVRFPRDIADKIIHLVRYHLFYYNVGEVTESGVRRFLRRVGPEHIDDLIKVREADRIGSGVPKALPYKLRHLLFMIEKVKRDPISPKMLKVNGDDIMEILKIKQGHKVGWILSVLLDEVLDDPKKNVKKNLEARIKGLGKLSDEELIKMSKQAREKKDEFESGVEEEIKKQFYVK